jgi:hypothetical protein
MIDAARRCGSPHLNRVEVQPSSHGEERSAGMDMAASGGLWAAPSSTGERAIQFAVTKFLATGSQVPLLAAITLRVQKPL